MIGDPYDDFLRRDEEQAEWLANRPVCEICGEPIQDESYHRLFEKNVCNRCLDDNVIFLEV